MSRHIWKELNALSEAELRTTIMLPVLQSTEGLEGITDVHGRNEAGLDIVFFTKDAIRRTCFGLQLKRGDIGGGAKARGTVQEVITQLTLAKRARHPIAVDGAGRVRIERFIVATSGNITENARSEIADAFDDLFIDFWDGHAIIHRVHNTLPQLLSGVDAKTIGYLGNVIELCDRLEALDQIQTVHRRTLSDIFEEPMLRRKFASTVVASTTSKPVRTPATRDSKDAPKPTSSARSVTPNILLKLGKSAVVIADQNDGKTSLFRMLAMRRARQLLGGSPDQDRDAIPVLCKVSRVAPLASLELAIVEEVEAKGGDSSTIAADLNEGRVLVFLDGFSELASEGEKQKCAVLVEAFSSRYKKVQLIISGRPADFLEPGFFEEFDHYTISSFSDDQVVSLARKYSRGIATNSDVAAKMVTRIREALQLPGSPIPAIIGVMVYEEEQRYITNTADAVDAYMIIRLGRYAREMGIKQEVEWSRKQDLLAEVAFEMVKARIDALPARSIIEQFNSIFERLGETHRGEMAFRELVESGVLVAFEDGIRFHRTSFRDFFAAQHLFRRLSSDFDQFFVDNLADKRWGQVLVFAAGLRRHNSKLLAHRRIPGNAARILRKKYSSSR